MGLLYALMIFELVDMFRFQLSFQLFSTGSILFLFHNLSMQGGAEGITVGISEGFSFFVNNYLVWFGNCVTLLKHIIFVSLYITFYSTARMHQ